MFEMSFKAMAWHLQLLCIIWEQLLNAGLLQTFSEFQLHSFLCVKDLTLFLKIVAN